MPNNPPVELTSFVGREKDLAELSALVSEHRLVTLVGAGGCGKSRLASQVAAEIADAHPDGVWWTELAPVADPSRVPWALMAVLGLGDDRGLDPLERIADYLVAQRVLLLLDNCEHVLAPVAKALDRLLRACPNLTAIATSREPLGVPGEVVWRVPPLSLPADVAQIHMAPDAALADLALRLVVALGLFWLVHGHFSEGLFWHRRVLARIPRRPSTLRCKAVWGLGHLSLTCVEMANGFGVAELDEALAHARELGDPALLARPLADQGLIQVYLAPDSALETLDEALESARRSGDEWAVTLVLWWQAFYGVLVRNRFDRATPILAALEGIGQRSGNVNCLAWNDIVTGMAAWQQGRLGEARVAMERARASAYECADPLLEMHAVEWQTGVRIAQGDYDGASALALQTALRLTRSLDGCRQGFIEFGLAEVALARGDLAGAATQAERVAPVIREIGLPFKLHRLEVLLGRVALAQNRLSAARTAFGAASILTHESNVPWILVDVHHHTGLLARAEDDVAVADDRHHQALALEVEYGFRGVAADTLEALASLAVTGGNDAEAGRLFGTAAALREATGQTRWQLDQSAYDADISAVRSALGEEVLAQLWKEGTALSLAEVASYASRARGERKRPRAGWAALTPTELEVVALAARGLTNAEIGKALFISAGTARIHLSHIYAKLGIANRAQLAAQATARAIR